MAELKGRTPHASEETGSAQGETISLDTVGRTLDHGYIHRRHVGLSLFARRRSRRKKGSDNMSGDDWRQISLAVLLDNTCTALLDARNAGVKAGAVYVGQADFSALIQETHSQGGAGNLQMLGVAVYLREGLAHGSVELEDAGAAS